MEIFFLGVSNLLDPGRLQKTTKTFFISVSRLLNRNSPLKLESTDIWVMDAGTYGLGQIDPYEYFGIIQKFSSYGNLIGVVSQDWLCLDNKLKEYGLTVAKAQQKTIERYIFLLELFKRNNCTIPLIPVIQGNTVENYKQHIKMYGDLLTNEQWVCVGSLKTRGVYEVEQILIGIHRVRPDLKLHGLGLTSKTLKSDIIFDLVYSADSQAWEKTARWGKLKTGNTDRLSYAIDFYKKVKHRQSNQLSIFAQ